MKSLFALPLLLAATAATAGWFVEDGSYQRRREEKVAVLSPARADALRRMIAERDARQAETVVLARLAAEKTAAVEEADERFAGEYGIRSDRNYTYDPSDMTVYLLSTDARHGGSPASPVRLAHRVFPTEEEAQAFLALMQAKQAAASARALFLATAAEKKAALEDVLARMGREYRLDPARSYRFDHDMRAIYVQYMPPPPPRVKTPEEIAAEMDAKAAAERKAREEAVARATALRAEAKRIQEERAKLSADQKESIRVRDEAIRRLEKELGELDEQEARLRKRDEERREEQARLAKREAEKAAREKARAEELAKREAERVAKELAKQKAEQERAAAIKAEEEALARHVAKVTSVRSARRDEAKRVFEEAERAERESEERFEQARRIYKLARSAGKGKPSEERLARLKLDIDNAQAALDRAKTVRKESRRALDEAEDRLGRAEKDATKAFDEHLRSKGKEPVRPSASGFFSWF